MKKLILLALAVTLTSGCANHETNIYFNKKYSNEGLDFDIAIPSGSRQQDAKLVKDNHYFLSGIFQKNSVDLSNACDKGKIKKIVIEQRWYQSALKIVTFGIYDPVQTSVYCE